MQELNITEIDDVNGALSMGGALNVIGGIAGVCSIIPGLQGAAAFAGGVYLGGQIVMWMAGTA